MQCLQCDKCLPEPGAEMLHLAEQGPLSLPHTVALAGGETPRASEAWAIPRISWPGCASVRSAQSDSAVCTLGTAPEHPNANFPAMAAAQPTRLEMAASSAPQHANSPPEIAAIEATSLPTSATATSAAAQEQSGGASNTPRPDAAPRTHASNSDAHSEESASAQSSPEGWTDPRRHKAAADEAGTRGRAAAQGRLQQGAAGTKGSGTTAPTGGSDAKAGSAGAAAAAAGALQNRFYLLNEVGSNGAELAAMQQGKGRKRSSKRDRMRKARCASDGRVESDSTLSSLSSTGVQASPRGRLQGVGSAGDLQRVSAGSSAVYGYGVATALPVVVEEGSGQLATPFGSPTGLPALMSHYTPPRLASHVPNYLAAEFMAAQSPLDAVRWQGPAPHAVHAMQSTLGSASGGSVSVTAGFGGSLFGEALPTRVSGTRATAPGELPSGRAVLQSEVRAGATGRAAGAGALSAALQAHVAGAAGSQPKSQAWVAPVPAPMLRVPDVRVSDAVPQHSAARAAAAGKLHPDLGSPVAALMPSPFDAVPAAESELPRVDPRVDTAAAQLLLSGDGLLENSSRASGLLVSRGGSSSRALGSAPLPPVLSSPFFPRAGMSGQSDATVNANRVPGARPAGLGDYY